jgi:hypothetical protein
MDSFPIISKHFNVKENARISKISSRNDILKPDLCDEKTISNFGLSDRNGLTNGNNYKIVSKINFELINGDGSKFFVKNNKLDVKFTDNSGLIDGNGLTNGNGLSIVKGHLNIKNQKSEIESHKQKKIENFKHRRKKRGVISLFICVLLFILPLNLYFWEFEGESNKEIIIDGQFNDWENQKKYIDEKFDVEDNVNIDIIKYGVNNDDFNYYFYLEFYGTCLNGYQLDQEDIQIAKFDKIQIFLDVDNDKSTGYEIKSMGADYLIEAEGYNNIIVHSTFQIFDSTANWYDWGGWSENTGHFLTGIKDKRFEAQVPINSLLCSGSDLLALFCAEDYSGNVDFSDTIITSSDRILRVTQSINENNEYSQNGNNKCISNLELISENVDAELNKIKLNCIGTINLDEVETVSLEINDNIIASSIVIGPEIELEINDPIKLKNNCPIDLNVIFKLSENSNARGVLGFELTSVDATLFNNRISTIIQNDSEMQYINAVPEKIVIDGAFGDWKNIQKNYDNDEEPIINPNLDLTSYQITSTPDFLSFCFNVDGKILEGTHSTSEASYKIIRKSSDAKNIEKPELNINQPELFNVEDNVPDLKGLDTAHVFMDVDQNSRTGYNIKNWYIGADYMIEITGKNGRIIASKYYKFKENNEINNNQKTWFWSELDEIPAGIGISKLETQIELSKLGINSLNDVDILFHISEWVSTNERLSGDFSIFDYQDEMKLNEITDKENNLDFHENAPQIIDTSILEAEPIGTRNGPVELHELATGDGAQSNDGFGWNVSSAGDINDDGYSDIIVGAPFNDSLNSDAGAVYIFFGYPQISIDDLNPVMANVSIYGEHINSHLGWSVGYAGDVNGDNVGDILIGAPDSKNGTVYLLYGEYILQAKAKADSIRIDNQSNATFTGGMVGDNFGYSVSGAGDVNNDGFDDLLIGAPGNDSCKGAAYIFYGNKLILDRSAVDANASIYGEKVGDRFGSSVSGSGNVNNDQYSDFLIGAPGYASDKGRAYLYYGCQEFNGWSENIKIVHWDEGDGAVFSPPGFGIYKGQFLAQSFSPEHSYRLTKVGMYLTTNGATPGNLVITLQGDSNGPDGNILTNSLAISSGPTTLTWVEVEFITPYVLNPGTKYWIVASGDGKNAINCWEWLEDENIGTDCTGGNGAYNGGGTKPWTQDPATSDYLLKIYGQDYLGLEPNATLEGGSKGDLFGFSVSLATKLGPDNFDDIIIGAPGNKNGSVFIINGSKNLSGHISAVGTWGDEKQIIKWEQGGGMELVIYNDSMGSSQSLSQSFIPEFDFNLTKVSLYLETVGIPGTLTIKLMGSTGTYPNTKPNNIVLAQANSISTGTKSYSWMNFSFITPYFVKTGAEYFIVADGTGSDTSNCWVWYVQATGSYSRGDYAFNQGGAWLVGNRDCYFKAFGRTKIIRPNITLEGQPGDMFGFSVSNAEDIDRDGFSEIVVGAPGNDSIMGLVEDAGSIFVFYGKSLKTYMNTTEANNVSYGEYKYARFGWSVDGIGDINGDGYNDILVGAPCHDNGSEEYHGKVYVMSYLLTSVIPEFNSIILPIILILIIISIFRKKYYILFNKKGVNN